MEIDITMEGTYHAGIIGLGFIGAGDQISRDALGQRVENLDGTHIAAYSNHPSVRIVCGSSRDEGRRTRFFSRVDKDVRVYTDWREMIHSAKPDIISIAAYTPAHAEMVILSVMSKLEWSGIVISSFIPSKSNEPSICPGT